VQKFKKDTTMSEKVKKDIKTKATKPKTKKKTQSKKTSSKEKEIKELTEKLAESNDKYLRLQAEFDNYRKRTLQEKMQLIENGGKDILKDLLPTLDNFERAIQSTKESSDVKAIQEGINLIYNSFKDFLNQKGVKEMEVLEKEFDSDFHEALTKIPAPKEELKGKVVDVIEKGYTLNKEVIRFAKVVVGE